MPRLEGKALSHFSTSNGPYMLLVSCVGTVSGRLAPPEKPSRWAVFRMMCME